MSLVLAAIARVRLLTGVLVGVERQFPELVGRLESILALVPCRGRITSSSADECQGNTVHHDWLLRHC